MADTQEAQSNTMDPWATAIMSIFVKIAPTRGCQDLMPND